ncbi:hypothetical protein [Mycobacterium sp. ZZG]
MSTLRTECGIELTATPVAQAVWSSTGTEADAPQLMEPSDAEGS